MTRSERIQRVQFAIANTRRSVHIGSSRWRRLYDQAATLIDLCQPRDQLKLTADLLEVAPDITRECAGCGRSYPPPYRRRRGQCRMTHCAECRHPALSSQPDGGELPKLDRAVLSDVLRGDVRVVRAIVAKTGGAV